MEEQPYTAIYVTSFRVGSHTHSITKMRRINKLPEETVLDMLNREGLQDDTVFLFVGCPKLEGE